MKSKIKISLFLTCLFPVLAGAQCAMCRAVLESSENKGQAEAINEGIMYLMIWPYILIGGIGFFVWWSLRKKSEKTSEIN